MCWERIAFRFQHICHFVSHGALAKLLLSERRNFNF